MKPYNIYYKVSAGDDWSTTGETVTVDFTNVAKSRSIDWYSDGTVVVDGKTYKPGETLPWEEQDNNE